MVERFGGGGAVCGHRGEPIGEIADLDVSERREGQAAAADQPQRGVGAPRADVAERRAALAFVAEGGEIGLKLDRRRRAARPRAPARLACW